MFANKFVSLHSELIHVEAQINLINSDWVYFAYRRLAFKPLKTGHFSSLFFTYILAHMVFFSRKIRPSYGQKLSILATIPLVLAVAAIAALVTFQSRQLAEKEIQSLEETLINAKKAELRNYVKQATLGFY